MINKLTIRLAFICLLVNCAGCQHNSCKYYADFDTLRDWLWQNLDARKASLLTSNYRSEFDEKDPTSIKFNTCSGFEQIIYNPKEMVANHFDYWISSGKHFLSIKEEIINTGDFNSQNPSEGNTTIFINPDWGEKITLNEIQGKTTLYQISFDRDPSLVVFASYNFYHRFFRWACGDNLNTTLPTTKFGFGSGLRHGFLLPIALIGKLTGAENNLFGGWAITTELYWLALIFGSIIIFGLLVAVINMIFD